MILCVLGGSAHSTPVLIDALARAVPDTEITVRLAGRDPARLQAVARACNLLAADTRIRTEAFAEDRWSLALTGSDVVLIQTRVGGYAARAFDESFSPPFGVPGDEGLGPGGLSAAYRSWPQMRNLFEQVRAIAPLAQVILLSSPLSLLVRLAAVAFPGWPLVGTCELPISTLDQICAATGAYTDQVRFGYTGVNHLGFLHHVYAKLPGHESNDLVMRYAARRHSDTFPSSDLVGRLGGFPLKYLRLHFAPEEIVAEQRRRPTSRSEDLTILAEHSFSVFRDGDAAAIHHALSARRAEWYELAVLPLLLVHLHVPVARPVFLTLADADGEVRERAYAARNGTYTPLPQFAPAPRAIDALVRSFIDYERAAAEAVLSGSASALADALALHPSLPHRHARALAKAIVDQPFVRSPKRIPDQEGELCRT
jgi:6-phospho-beta-glucosidase